MTWGAGEGGGEGEGGCVSGPGVQRDREEDGGDDDDADGADRVEWRGVTAGRDALIDGVCMRGVVGVEQVKVREEGPFGGVRHREARGTGTGAGRVWG